MSKRVRIATVPAVIEKLSNQKDTSRAIKTYLKTGQLITPSSTRRWEKEEIIDKLKEIKNIEGTVTQKILTSYFHKDRDLYPSYKTVEQAFYIEGSKKSGWERALDSIGVSVRGRRKRQAEHENLVYYVNLVKDLKIKSIADYEKARKKMPDVVPSTKKMKQVVGSFVMLKRLVKITSHDKQLSSLLKLIQERNNRYPTKELCKARGIDRSFLEGVFGGRASLKELCYELIRINTL